jgi:vancomycin resistance protein VanJ
MASALRFLLTTGLTWAALGMHLVVSACYMRRWDQVAAITVFPFWIWALAGVGMAGLAWIISRRRMAAVICLLWLATLFIGSDETRPLLRWHAEKPLPGPAALVDGTRPLRIVTLNCRAGMWNPQALQDLVPWDPDIVFLQEAPAPLELQRAAARLYGNPTGHWEGGYHCGLLARGRISNTLTGWQPASILATVEWTPGKFVEVGGVHLQGAETTVKLWNPSALRSHRLNRQSRRFELARVLSVQRFISRQHPAIIGGDFNAPAGDAIFDLLKEAGFRDSFAEAGSGWPDTYPNATPVLRIDHLWVNSRIKPVRAIAVETKHSDHRMIVCDFLVP